MKTKTTKSATAKAVKVEKPKSLVLRRKKVNCWESYSPLSDKVIYVDESLTRDQARKVYTEKTGITHNDTRASRVK